jgi:predicted DNA-binding transcriptional regulator AlpA
MDNFILLTEQKLNDLLDSKINQMCERLIGVINQKDVEENDVIDVKEASKLTGLSVNTLYQYSSRNEIPKLAGKSKKLLFSRTELSAWNNADRPKILKEAIDNLIKKQSPNQLAGR